MSSIQLESKIVEYLTAAPFQLIIQVNRLGIDVLETNSLDVEDNKMSDICKFYLKQNLKSGKYIYGEYFYNPKNIFPYLIIISKKVLLSNKEFYYFNNEFLSRVAVTLDNNKQIVKTETYKKAGSSVTINFVEIK
jgi:hypothetical protein